MFAGVFRKATGILSVPKSNSHCQVWHADYQGSLSQYYEKYDALKMCSLSVLHFPMGGYFTYLKCDIDASRSLLKKQITISGFNAKARLISRKGDFKLI
jgi:hypothetical protein